MRTRRTRYGERAPRERINAPYKICDRTNDSSAIGRDWKLDLIPVDDLEEITQYNFLNNIPTEIQDVIEARPYDEILQRFDNLISGSSSASLLADTQIVGGTTLHTSIRHYSIPKNSTTSINGSGSSNNTFQISRDQESPFQNSIGSN